LKLVQTFLRAITANDALPPLLIGVYFFHTGVTILTTRKAATDGFGAIIMVCGILLFAQGIYYVSRRFRVKGIDSIGAGRK
jgi:uncharacterized membrane protein HdeD (DUF308 family)